jgi:hypothetical protein
MRVPTGLAYSLERRLPASCLLITPSVELANSVYGTLERDLGSRIWVWQEPAVEPAVRVLSVCRFRLILLDLMPADTMPGPVLRAIKQASPTTPLVLLAAGPDTPLTIERKGLGDAQARLAGAAAVLPRSDAAALGRVVRQILATPVADPPDPA